MKTILASALSALVLLALPASAQTLSVLLPTLTWPEGDVTVSTKDCTPQTAAPACPAQE